MSDELKELERRLIEDCKREQINGDYKLADGIRVALFEIEHLSEDYVG